MASLTPSFQTDYSFYGCRLRSCIPLEGFPCAEGGAPVDVVLEPGEVPESLTDPVFSSSFVQIGSEGMVLIQVPAIGRFLISGGSTITFQATLDTTTAALETLLSSTVAGALLHQRGVLPLHASSVRIGGRAVAIAGCSYRGKSTLAAALVNRGATLLSDDICPVWFTASNSPLAVQGSTLLRLWPDSRQALGAPQDTWLPTRTGHSKCVRSFGLAPQAPLSLAAVVRLADDKRTTQAGLRRLHGAAAASPQEELIYRVRFARMLGHREELFRDLMRVAAAVPFFELCRPPGLDDIHQAAEWIETAVGACA